MGPENVVFTRLLNGLWGIRAEGEIETGELVEVTRKEGGKKVVTVGRVLWNDGTFYVAEIAGHDRKRGKKS